MAMRRNIDMAGTVRDEQHSPVPRLLIGALTDALELV